MKKNILSALLLLFAVSAMADNEIIDNSYRWYVQAHINGSSSANENLRFADFKKSLGWGADASIGYNFNDYWGMYLQVAYNKNKGGLIFESTNTTFDSFDFTSIEATINGTYNVSNGFLGYKPGRKNNFYIHGGVGAAFTTSIDSKAELNGINRDKKTTWTCNLGVNYVHNFTNWLALTADVTGHIFGDKFNGVDSEVPFDGRANLGIGLRFYISRNAKPAYETVYVDQIKTIVDTVRTQVTVGKNLQDVYSIAFDTNSDKLSSDQSSTISKVAEALKAQPAKVVYVIGCADKNTEATNNANLAKTRADIVTKELVNTYGIDPDRIITHDEGDKVQPYQNANNNSAALCIITDLKHQ